MKENVHLEQMPGDLLILILSHLDLQSLASLESASKYFRNFINSPVESSQLFLDINLRRESVPVATSWLLLKILKHKIQSLSLSGTQYDESEILSLIAACGNDLKTLDLSFCYLDESFYRCLGFRISFLSELIVKDADLIDDKLACLLQFTHLKKLRVSNNNFLKGHSFYKIKEPLVELDCDGCEKLKFEALNYVVKLSRDSMRELLIDGEHFTTEQVCYLLRNLPKLCRFGIYFANEMDNSIFESLHDTAWEFLTINKGTNLQEPGFSNLFSIPNLQLQELHLCECSEISDSALINIGTNCPNLRSLSLTWCMNVRDIGISTIIFHCHFIKTLTLTGLKFLTDGGFPTDPMPTVYSRLKLLNLSQCDRVPDSHLWTIQLAFPRMKILNYYGETFSAWRKCV